MPSSKVTLAAGSLSAGIIALDQISKDWVRTNFGLEEKREILAGFFDLTYLQNTGAAWGVFHGQNEILAALCAVAVAGILLFRHTLAQTPGQTLALGAIVGGILGNFLDRLLLGGVTDFLYFHWHNSYWPAFNVADSAICVGVFFYVLITFRADRKAAQKQKKEAEKAPGEL